MSRQVLADVWNAIEDDPAKRARLKMPRVSGDQLRGILRTAGNLTSIASEELAEIILYCWRQPSHICIRDIVVMPTNSGC